MKHALHGETRHRREGIRTLNEECAGHPVFRNREVGYAAGCGISDALNHTLCQINWCLLNQSHLIGPFCGFLLVFSFKEMTGDGYVLFAGKL